MTEDPGVGTLSAAVEAMRQLFNFVQDAAKSIVNTGADIARSSMRSTSATAPTSNPSPGRGASGSTIPTAATRCSRTARGSTSARIRRRGSGNSKRRSNSNRAMGGCLDGGRSTLVPHPLSYTDALTSEQVNPQLDDFRFVSKIQAFGN